jgi:hypothetical protein
MNRDESTGVDVWTDRQERSLQATTDVLSVVGCAADLAVKDAPAHASFVDAGTVVDVVVVSGSRHQENLAHAEQFYPGRMDRRTLIVSCDRDDNPMTNRDGSIYAGNRQVSTRDNNTTPAIVLCGWNNIKNMLIGTSEEDIVAALRRYMRIDDGHPVSTTN